MSISCLPVSLLSVHDAYGGVLPRWTFVMPRCQLTGKQWGVLGKKEVQEGLQVSGAGRNTRPKVQLRGLPRFRRPPTGAPLGCLQGPSGSIKPSSLQAWDRGVPLIFPQLSQAWRVGRGGRIFACSKCLSSRGRGELSNPDKILFSTC